VRSAAADPSAAGAAAGACVAAFDRRLNTDNVTIDDLVALAQSFGTPDPSKVTFYTLPTHTSPVNPDALTPDTDTATPVFQALLDDQPLPDASTAPAPSTPAGAATDRSTPTPTVPVPALSGLAAAALSPVNAAQPQCA